MKWGARIFFPTVPSCFGDIDVGHMGTITRYKRLRCNRDRGPAHYTGDILCQYNKNDRRSNQIELKPLYAE